MRPFEMTAAEAARLIRDRRLSAEELVRSCLDRIAARDADVRAWLFLDSDLAVRRARELDKRMAQDGPIGPLHGVPLGVKDVIDTCDMPTTQNSPIYADARVGRDAACVAVARHSGALVLGKTDMVEFASGGRKALTRNPFNLGHTPGGSSSGSGAAVGDLMVPLAFGTQTAGSHIRPASFNNLYALKPSWSLVSREGVRMAAISLDTVGWFGRSVGDLALVADAFRLPGQGAQPTVSLRGLRVGLCRSPVWDRVEPAGEAAMEAAAKRLQAAGAIVEPLELPAPFAGLTEARAVIGRHEGGAAFLPEYLGAHHLLAAELRERVEARAAFDAAGLLAAYALADACRPAFDGLFGPGLDVVLTPAAPGEAPEGLHTTGDWIFNGIWTLLHVPCIAVPCIRGPQGLPVGVQLVGPRLADARLLAIAAACAPAIDAEPGWAREALCA